MRVAFTFFSAKNIRILYTESAKTVNEMTLNELVKLTTLWTTGPCNIVLYNNFGCETSFVEMVKMRSNTIISCEGNRKILALPFPKLEPCILSDFSTEQNKRIKRELVARKKGCLQNILIFFLILPQKCMLWLPITRSSTEELIMIIHKMFWWINKKFCMDNYAARGLDQCI